MENPSRVLARFIFIGFLLAFFVNSSVLAEGIVANQFIRSPQCPLYDDLGGSIDVLLYCPTPVEVIERNGEFLRIQVEGYCSKRVIQLWRPKIVLNPPLRALEG